MNRGSNKIITFLVLAVFMVIYPFYVIIQSGSLSGNEGFIFLVMWVPAIAAVITKLIWDKNLRDLGLGLGKIKYIGIGYLLPVIAGILVYGLVWVIGLGGIDTEFIKLSGVYDVFRFFVLGVLLSAITAVGEEIGWRGFLVPELFKKFSFFKTSLIMAVIWNVYHYPLLLFSDYNNGVSVISSLVFFTISVTGVCFITTYLRIKSNSMWPAVTIHASHNYFIQSVFDPMTIDRGMTRIFTTEFGVGLAVIYLLMGMYFWKKSRNLQIKE